MLFASDHSLYQIANTTELRCSPFQAEGTSLSESRELVAAVRRCRECEDILPLGPKPIFQVDPRARILVVGQAPGCRAHQSGIPFDDPSGDRLRSWMGVDKTTFYDSQRVALLPMAFCYPGTGDAGDLPPPKVCAQKWRASLLSILNRIEVTVLCGKYAIDWHLGTNSQSLSKVVARWRELPDKVLTMPHPSGRNNGWLRRNPWFEAQLVPELKARIARALEH